MTMPGFIICLLAVLLGLNTRAEPVAVAADFRRDVQPILENYCYDCHADGANKGDVAFDEYNPDANPADSRDLWWKALKNVRSGLMPPAKKARPTPAEQELLTHWIKHDIFGIDPADPDPGRVTLRRLNRAEYRNTIRDLLGVDYDTASEFPPDDTGNGFDNLGEVLNLSPMLLEKYLNAAQAIIAQSVPMTSRVVAETTISGASFGPESAALYANHASGSLALSYYQAAAVSNSFKIEHPGRYQIVLHLSANEKYVENEFDYNQCRLLFKVDGQELFRHDYNREGGRPLHYEFDQQLPAGPHLMSVEIQPLPPATDQIRALNMRLQSITLRGPFADQYAVEPPNYRRFFPRDVPAGRAARRDYARELLGNFARQAFRRPVDPAVVNRLTDLAESLYRQPHQTFEAGVAQAMVAVLASPRFLFREEGVETTGGDSAHPLVDEYTLASRLSYFLWSSMPDAELFRLADQGELRKNLPAQVTRLLADGRSAALMENFSGQWLQTRDIATVAIDSRSVLALDAGEDPDNFHSRRFGRQRNLLDEPARRNLKSETDQYFGYIVHADRDVTELIDSDYTFLNESLARYYGLTNLDVYGENFRKVTLPPDSQRGGVLTMGSVLAATSNPTRTSPVKRGRFILDNILGTPSPPAPPNIPPLEASESAFTNHQPTLREVLALHRSQPLCASCHDRLDPPGLGLENFNALGLWRATDHGQPITVNGKLVTGEPFDNARDLKHILATQHRTDFYRCLTEKLLTYALGRGLDYYDVETVDQIVEQLQQNNGRFSVLLLGVVESVPFQKTRAATTVGVAQPDPPARALAQLK